MFPVLKHIAYYSASGSEYNTFNARSFWYPGEIVSKIEKWYRQDTDTANLQLKNI
jgi:hypothetical protein